MIDLIYYRYISFIISQENLIEIPYFQQHIKLLFIKYLKNSWYRNVTPNT